MLIQSGHSLSPLHRSLRQLQRSAVEVLNVLLFEFQIRLGLCSLRSPPGDTMEVWVLGQPQGPSQFLHTPS